MDCFGLLGEKLSHSFSPAIHKLLGSYEYKLYEKKSEEVKGFLSNCSLSGMNVTIPYKKTVIPYCDYLSPTAKKLGSVNTLIKKDNSWHGFNTDYYGFSYMIKSSNIDIKGKKAIVLGSGGASLTVVQVLRDMGIKEVVVISRTGDNNYDNLNLHYNSEIIVNTTPVGMYPDNMVSPIELKSFKNCQGVFDLIYNPLKTKLLMDAESLQIPYSNGLTMLVAQAKKSAELFTDSKIPNERTEEIINTLKEEASNIVLVGMPGCGKSTTGKILASITGKKFIDCDEEIVKNAGMSIEEIFQNKGEDFFRNEETKVIENLGKQKGLIIATGGGCVIKKENYSYLHQNGLIIWIKRDISLLCVEGRPLSKTNSLEKMYEIRKQMYESFCDYEVKNNTTAKETAEKIKECIK